MSLPWHFVSVSAEEKQRRRELLDLRGYYAQFSIGAAILGIRLYNCYFCRSHHAKKNDGQRRPRSWWDSPPLAGWSESRRQYAVCLLWLAWLLSLSMWGTGDDYLHLTKSLGHVALSQLPLQVLMSPALPTKASAPSLVSVLTSTPQSSLTPYHRLFGRLVIAPLLVSHAALYLSFFAQSSHPDFGTLLAKRVLDEDVQWGIAGVSVLLAVLLFVRPAGSPRWVRLLEVRDVKSRRRVFYAAHVLLVGVLCGAAFWHVRQARVFVGEVAVAFGVNWGCCWGMS